ncbi:MAG TPA: hypothetical protein VNU68_01270, partial [Verrucomicrobiae bacterium]|nr:hypothetical protein [Verrucomicrobiae bacterium]
MKVPSEILDLFKEIGTSINALVEDPNVLGEPWRSQLLEIKGQINASLREMPDTDRVPAAQVAANGLDYLKSQLLCVGHIISALSGIVKSSSEKTTTALASITPEVERQVAAKLAAGDYLAKADAESLAGKARQEGDLTGFARGKQLADRRSALAVAGL